MGEPGDGLKEGRELTAAAVVDVGVAPRELVVVVEGAEPAVAVPVNCGVADAMGVPTGVAHTASAVGVHATEAPAGHAEHGVHTAAPGALYAPAPQAVHTVPAVAPATALYMPAAHAVQAEAPLASAL
jgi:hypothetical protein